MAGWPEGQRGGAGRVPLASRESAGQAAAAGAWPRCAFVWLLHLLCCSCCLQSTACPLAPTPLTTRHRRRAPRVPARPAPPFHHWPPRKALPVRLCACVPAQHEAWGPPARPPPPPGAGMMTITSRRGGGGAELLGNLLKAPRSELNWGADTSTFSTSLCYRPPTASDSGGSVGAQVRSPSCGLSPALALAAQPLCPARLSAAAHRTARSSRTLAAPWTARAPG